MFIKIVHVFTGILIMHYSTYAYLDTVQQVCSMDTIFYESIDSAAGIKNVTAIFNGITDPFEPSNKWGMTSFTIPLSYQINDLYLSKVLRVTEKFISDSLKEIDSVVCGEWNGGVGSTGLYPIIKQDMLIFLNLSEDSTFIYTCKNLIGEDTVSLIKGTWIKNQSHDSIVLLVDSCFELDTATHQNVPCTISTNRIPVNLDISYSDYEPQTFGWNVTLLSIKKIIKSLNSLPEDGIVNDVMSRFVIEFIKKTDRFIAARTRYLIEDYSGYTIPLKNISYYKERPVQPSRIHTRKIETKTTQGEKNTNSIFDLQGRLINKNYLKKCGIYITNSHKKQLFLHDMYLRKKD